MARRRNDGNGDADEALFQKKNNNKFHKHPHKFSARPCIPPKDPRDPRRELLYEGHFWLILAPNLDVRTARSRAPLPIRWKPATHQKTPSAAPQSSPHPTQMRSSRRPQSRGPRVEAYAPPELLGAEEGASAPKLPTRAWRHQRGRSSRPLYSVRAPPYLRRRCCMPGFL